MGEEKDDAIDMTEDFEGDVEDVEEDAQSSDEENGTCYICFSGLIFVFGVWCTDEREDESLQMGDLAADQPEELDRNMWAPEENNEDQQVREFTSIKHGGGHYMPDYQYDMPCFLFGVMWCVLLVFNLYLHVVLFNR